MKTSLILTLIGPDRPGLVSVVSACAGAHGANWMESRLARLAGQFADYTATQLIGFRDGTRTNSTVMAGVVAKMNDREIKAVADYIAGLR